MKTLGKIQMTTSAGLKDTAIDTGKVVLAAGAGSFLGAAVGKYSFPVGLIATGIGIHKGIPALVVGGVGMMAGGAYKTATSMNGLAGPEDVYGFEGGIDGFNIKDMFMGAKERLSNWLTVHKGKVLFVKPNPSANPNTPQKRMAQPMKGMGEAEAMMLGMGNTEYVMSNTDDFSGMNGEATEMTIASLSNLNNVQLQPESGTTLLGMDAMGRIL